MPCLRVSVPDPYIHLELPDGTIPLAPCRATAIVVTSNPWQLTCPQCVEHLSEFLDALEIPRPHVNTPSPWRYAMPDDRALLHRYHADPRWRILVDSLLDRLVCESYSPTDVREAAQCAIVKYLGPVPQTPLESGVCSCGEEATMHFPHCPIVQERLRKALH